MSQTLTKRDLVAVLHARYGWPKARLNELLDELGALVEQALVEGHTVILPGLGRLSTTATAERSGRNPGTGAPVTIPAGRRVRFKPTKSLKEAL